MRVAIFSDVHGNLAALEAVLGDIATHGVDEIIFAGDLCLLGPRPEECVDLLRDRSDIAPLYGNTDEQIDDAALLSRNVVEEEKERWQHIHNVVDWTRETLSEMNRAWLGNMPFHRRISPTVQPHDDLFVVHANPQDVHQPIFPPLDLQRELYGEVRQDDGALGALLDGLAVGVLAFGHLHIPSIRHWKDLMLVNVSAVSISGDGDPRAKYAILEWDGAQWRAAHHYVEYDVQAEIDAYRRNRPPGWEKAVRALESEGMIRQVV